MAKHLLRPDAPGEHPASFDVDAEVAGPVCRKVLDRLCRRLGADDRRHPGDRRAVGRRPDAPVEVAALDKGGATPDEFVLRGSALDALEVRDVDVPGFEGGDVGLRLGRRGKSPRQGAVAGAVARSSVHDKTARQIDCKNQFHVLNAITIRVKDH
ncbi:MAG: hypothetical protein BWX50_00486 [Euryarchaeota archaeon ADurb.Bin009]|nr:MAG: hypothetical protein BWX50_00486 [Euryarchaeota archaeon ADurb.Bin009]